MGGWMRGSERTRTGPRGGGDRGPRGGASCLRRDSRLSIATMRTEGGGREKLKMRFFSRIGLLKVREVEIEHTTVTFRFRIQAHRREKRTLARAGRGVLWVTRRGRGSGGLTCELRCTMK